MQLTALFVLAYCVSCTFGVENEAEEIEYYFERVQQTIDLDFGHGNIRDKHNLSSKFEDMTLSELKETLAELYRTLECSYIINLCIHSCILKWYFRFSTKPNLTAEEIETYSFVKETQRMLTAMHIVNTYSTAKFIMWAYLVYTEKIAKIMRHPDKNLSSDERKMMAVVYHSVENLLHQFVQHSTCKHLFYKEEEVFSGCSLNDMGYHEWTTTLTNTRQAILNQLDFNDSKGVNPTDDNNMYSLNVLHLKGVFDESGRLNYLIRKFLVNGNWNEAKFKTRGLLVLPENVDCNSLKISSVRFKELRETIQTDYFPSLVEQIRHLANVHCSFIQLLKVVPLQLINKYLFTVLNPIDSCIEDRIPLILDFNKKITTLLSIFVEILDLGHDKYWPGIVRFFVRFSDHSGLNLYGVRTFQTFLNKYLECNVRQLYEGPIIKYIMFEDFRTTQANSNSAANTNSLVQTEDVTTGKLNGLVNDLSEIITYVIKRHITNLIDFKVIHSFIDIYFSEDFIRLEELETFYIRTINVT